ncbi:MAG TPA: T9SS type A sorting domain-containing protein [Bacteroidia bacterium]|jgi:uncharacterized protein (DUF2141 family)|nr:T9SS type A sorting domain-containing protein [Bacteroidia bacterium]
MKTKIHLLTLILAFVFLKASAYVRVDSIQVVNSSSCSACNGTAKAIVSGGFAPYTYYWSNSATTQTITGLCPGSYYVVVQDAHGDTTAAFCNVGPASLSAYDSTTNSACSSNTGTASVYIFGGTAPYTFAWSNGATTSSQTGLSAGTYTVKITDHGGCTDSLFVTINSGLTISLSETDVLCSGGSNGSATVTNVTGGTGPYTYSWAPSGGNGATATGLSAGYYSVTVTDHLGCSGTASVYINQPYPLTLDSASSITGATCGSSNGSASVSVFGGTPAYTYSWAPSGGTNATANGLSTGTYRVTVTDNNGCTLTTSIFVPSTGPIPSIVTVDDSCYGQTNGSAMVTSVSGGTAPYTYGWAPGGSTNSSINGLSAGTYTLSVTDHTGCLSTTLVNIYQPGMLTAVIDTMPDTGSCSGMAYIYVSGGTGPYTYTWSSHVNNSMDTAGMDMADSLCTGVYFMCVTDAHGCSTCDSVHVRHAPHHVTGIDNIVSSGYELKLYPNPANSQLNILISGSKNSQCNMDVYDMMGRQVMQRKNVEITQGNSISLDVSALSDGTYMFRVSDEKSSKITPFVISH